MQSKRPGFANVLVGGIGVTFTTNEVASVQKLPVLEQELRAQDQATIDQLSNLQADFISKISAVEYSVDDLISNKLPQIETNFQSQVQILSNRLDALDSQVLSTLPQLQHDLTSKVQYLSDRIDALDGQVSLINNRWNNYKPKFIFVDWVLPYIHRSFQSSTGRLLSKAQMEDPNVTLNITAKQMREKLHKMNAKEKIIPLEDEPDEESCKEIQAVLKEISPSLTSSK